MSPRNDARKTLGRSASALTLTLGLTLTSQPLALAAPAAPTQVAQEHAAEPSVSPYAPDIEVESVLSATSISLNWAKSPQVGNYGNYKITVTDETGAVAATRSANYWETSATISGLPSNHTYTAVVSGQIDNSWYDSAPSAPLKLSEDPGEVTFTVTPNTGIVADEDVNLMVTGTGYTGGATEHGVYIVVAKKSAWTPGERPKRNFSRSILVKPEEIKNGVFQKTLDLKADELSLGDGEEYIVGTIAAGDLMATDRRLDKATPIRIRPNAVTNLQASVTDRTIEASWNPPAGDNRITDYDVTLYRVTDKGTEFADKRAVGARTTNVQFRGVANGEYVVEVKAGVRQKAEDLYPEYSKPVRSSRVKVAPATTTPSAPAKPYLLKGGNGSPEVWWLKPSDGGSPITSYRIELTAKSDGSKLTFADIDPEASSFSLAGKLKRGETYTAVVYAINANGSSPASPTSNEYLVPGGDTPAPKPDPIPEKQRFSDVKPSDMFYTEIQWLAAKGITTGYGDGTFRPHDAVNRDAMAAFFYRAAHQPAYETPKDSPFRDVKPTDAFYKEIAWLSAKGISRGWDDGSYRPLDPIHRDAMAAFIYRYVNSR